MQMVTREDCVEAANPSLARRMRFRLLAQRGIGRKYGFTVDSLCGSPLCIRDEHVVYRPWKAFTRPTKWGEYETEISKLRGGIGANRLARLARFTVRRLSGSTGVRITKIGTWESRNTGG